MGFAASSDTLVEKSWAQLSDKEVSDWSEVALTINPTKWKHGETEHFVIHYFRYGQLIATRSEKFYDRIREFFGNRPDQLPGHKSHIFAFHEPADWRAFVEKIELPESCWGVTHGDEFFYFTKGERSEFDYDARVQAHEMTHLVFNRFFVGRLPLWLNEGVAEYFAQHTNIAEFRRYMRKSRRFKLDKLFTAKGYPEDKIKLGAFYAEASAVVDFMTYTPDRSALLPKCIEAMIHEYDMQTLSEIYGYLNEDDFKKAYERYRMLY